MGMLFKPFRCGAYLPNGPCCCGLIVFRYFCPDFEESLLCQQRPCWLHQPARLFVFAGLTALEGFLSVPPQARPIAHPSPGQKRSSRHGPASDPPESLSATTPHSPDILAKPPRRETISFVASPLQETRAAVSAYRRCEVCTPWWAGN